MARLWPAVAANRPGLAQVLALMRRSLAVALATLATVASIVAYAASRSGEPVKISSFEFLGCSGDWNDKEVSPEIWRMGSANGMTYLVRHPATCGANVARGEKATFRDGVLDLSYEPYSKDDIYAACMCEFWAKFTFLKEPAAVRSATFDGQRARLKGAWPEG